MTDPVIIRAMVPGDLPYVFSTFLRDLRDADSSGLPDDLWFPPHRALIERLLSDTSIVALVAAAADQPTEILGYCIAQPETALEWIHVRKPLRRKGLAKRLLIEAKCPEGTPARWSTPASRQFLRNPLRSRDIRRRGSTGSRSPSSPR